MFGKFSCPLSPILMKGCSISMNKAPSSPNKPRRVNSICQRSVKNKFLEEICSCSLYRLHRWVHDQHISLWPLKEGVMGKTIIIHFLNAAVLFLEVRRDPSLLCPNSTLKSQKVNQMRPKSLQQSSYTSYCPALIVSMAEKR